MSEEFIKYASEQYVDDKTETIQENVDNLSKTIPTKTSQLSNDSGFITKVVGDLTNYYLKSETYTRTEIGNLISTIPKFAISVVSSLPTSNISGTTVYLVRNGSNSGNLYTEYIYSNGAWEILGSQEVDLTGYTKQEEVSEMIATEFEIQLENFYDKGEIDVLLDDVRNEVDMKLDEFYDQSEIDLKLEESQNEVDGKIEAAKEELRDEMPTELPNPNALTFTGAASGSYDGSSAKTVNIPEVPSALPNPNALTFTGGATESYDGSSAKTVNIPSKTSELTNDSEFITKAVNDLANYYLRSETYNRTEIGNLISAIPKFAIRVVPALPTSGISTTTVYLLKSSDESGNLYEEYIYANDAWELLGTQNVDLSDYPNRIEVDEMIDEAKTEIQGNFPASLPNPKVLYFNGAVSDSYDGSATKTISIPTIPNSLKNPYALDFTGAVTDSYDGSTAKTVHIPTVPTSLKNPHTLKFTGGATATYDGSAEVSVNIPTTLKNPYSLIINGTAYDGSEVVNMTISEEGGTSGYLEIYDTRGTYTETVVYTQEELNGNKMDIDLGIELVDGGLYTVKWNGEEYSCIASGGVDEYGDSLYVLGNDSSVTRDCNHEPFYIVQATDAGSLVCFIIDNTNSDTVEFAICEGGITRVREIQPGPTVELPFICSSNTDGTSTLSTIGTLEDAGFTDEDIEVGATYSVYVGGAKFRLLCTYNENPSADEFAYNYSDVYSGISAAMAHGLGASSGFFLSVPGTKEQEGVHAVRICKEVYEPIPARYLLQVGSNSEGSDNTASADESIVDLSVSGTTITYTKGNGTSGTITTQDTNTTYSKATTSSSGLMGSDDKAKLDGIESGANNYTLPVASSSQLGGVKPVDLKNYMTQQVGVDSEGALWTYERIIYSPTTDTVNGLFSVANKKKLDGIDEGANAYVLPVASTALGGVRTTSDVNSNVGLTPCPIIDGVPYYSNPDSNASGLSLGYVTASIPSVTMWADVAYGNNVYVAVGCSDGIAAYSTNGISWVQTTIPVGDYYCVEYGNGVFAAIGDRIAAYSTDGINWTKSPSTLTGFFVDVCYGGNQFMAVAFDSNIVASSADGINWTEVTHTKDSAWMSIAYGYCNMGLVAGNAFVISSTDLPYVLIHIDGESSWYSTESFIIESTATARDRIVYGNGKFVSIQNGTNVASYCTDGINWIDTELPATASWSSLAFCNGTFVAIAPDSKLAAYSYDGMTWMGASLPVSNLWAVSDAGGKFIAIGGENCITYSTSGNVWKTEGYIITQGGVDVTGAVYSAIT